MVSATAGLLAMASAILAFAGQALSSETLRRLPLAALALKPNTALCSGLIGLALFLTAMDCGDNRWHEALRRASAALVVAIGGLTTLRYLFGIDIGVDTLLFRTAGSGTLLAGPMAPITGEVYLLLGAIFVARPRRDLAGGLVEALGLAAFALTALACFTILYGLQPTVGFGSGVRTTPRSAVNLLILSAGTLLLDPSRGIVALLRSAGPAGAIGRRLVPAALVVPALVGAAQMAGIRLGLYEPSYGLVFAVLFDMIILAALVVWATRSIERSDRSRNIAETELSSSERRFRAMSERFSLALDAGSMGIWDWDVVQDRLEWDDRTLALYGMRREEFSGGIATWTQRVHPDDLKRVWDSVERALRGEEGGEYAVEFRATLPDGSVRFMRANGQVTRDASGRPLRMTGINFDITDRKRSEDEIRRANALLNLTGRMAQVGGWEFDAATGEGSWTEEVARIHDVDPGQRTNKDFGLGFYTPDARAKIEAAIQNAIESAEPYDLELEMVSSKGLRKWVHTVGMPVLFDGAVARVQGIFQDITERKRIEAVLQASERTLRLFIENSPAAIAMFDCEMRYLLASRRWMESYALGDRDIVGKSHYEIFPEIGEDWKSVHRRCLAGAIESREEDPFPRADGSLDWVRWEVRPWYTAEGKIGGIIIFSEVITERKKAELAVRESEERYRNLFDNMVEGLAYCKMTFDGDRPVDWTYLAVNPAFERLTGLSGVAGRRVSEVIPGVRESDPELFDIYGRVASTGIAERFEIDLRALDMWFSVAVYSPERGYFISVFDVITERKRAEAEVQKLNAELEERVGRRTAELEAANAELEAFSYSVSHDLRSPLRGIDGWSLALQEDYAASLDDTAREYIGRLRSEAKRMGNLIDDLLQLSRVSRAALQESRVDLSALALAVAERAKAGYVARSIEIAVEPNLFVRGDEGLLDIALFNLFDNAMKFTGPRPEARIEFGATEEEGHRLFFLRDNGVGFDMTYADKLFAPFQRLHRSSEFPGTGVGLATVRRVIAKHGGTIRVESRRNEGTVFYFSLGGEE